MRLCHAVRFVNFGLMSTVHAETDLHVKTNRCATIISKETSHVGVHAPGCPGAKSINFLDYEPLKEFPFGGS
jgi:hypothetical protein